MAFSPLKKSKIFLILMIFINVSSLIASELHNFPTVQSQSSFENKGDRIEQLYNEDGLLVYDSVLKLIEDIENGNLDDICTDEEWQKINYFIASLAKHGMMPNTTDEEKTEIEIDIQELLNPIEKDFRFENYSYTNDNYQITHAIYYGQNYSNSRNRFFIRK